MTTLEQLETTIDAAFEARDTISLTTTGDVRDAVEAALKLLDSGEARVAESKMMVHGMSINGLKKLCSYLSA